MHYILTVNSIGKTSKFLYVVVDQDGNEISRRISFRKYVACTIYGQYYFGRLDLIGKGEHGRQLKLNPDKDPVPMAFITPERVKVWGLESMFESFAEKQFNDNHPEANP